LGKLRVLSGKEICSLLRASGFVEVRQRGSHVVMQKKLADNTITVPVPLHSEIRIGTLQSIIRQSRLNRVEFETGN
jgi:predicted RNA binding protein YcfA (HicA-like mRNA interferase family)